MRGPEAAARALELPRRPRRPRAPRPLLRGGCSETAAPGRRERSWKTSGQHATPGAGRRLRALRLWSVERQCGADEARHGRGTERAQLRQRRRGLIAAGPRGGLTELRLNRAERGVAERA